MKFTLRELRARNRYSQKELAEKTGLAISTIYGYERNLETWKSVQYKTLESIAETLGVEVEDIDMDRI